ncbi:MAG: ATP-dependent helicase [Acinetobacter sp.]
MAGYETDIDYAFLMTCTDKQIEEYAESNFCSETYKSAEGFNFSKRVKFIRALCMLLKLTPSKEQWIFLFSDCERLLCEACAGAGKTTMAQLKLVDEKVSRNVHGRNILALAYNNHAVKDMRMKHEEIINRLNLMKIPGLNRDREICCHTFHSFCLAWVLDYADRFKLQPNNFMVVDKDVTELMRFASDTYKRKHPDQRLFVSDAIISALISLYMFTHETLTGDDPTKWKLCTAMTDLKDISLNAITEIFKYYVKAKSLKHRMDFADIIDAMYTICCDPAVMRRIRANYSIFLVDEYQDITPSMLRIIHLIFEGNEQCEIEPYYAGKLICIGDGDQSIYGFRGTDPDNCIRFRDAYSNPKMMTRITSMSENRRCPVKIIDVARKVIESNDRRIEKPILSIRDGGNIRVINYVDESDQMSQLVTLLKSKPAEDLRHTCICYRNLSSSYMLTIQLVASGIPFKIGRGNMPLTDKLSASVFGVLNMLSYPDNIEHIRDNLFKVVPKSARFTRAAIEQMLREEVENRKAGDEAKRFWELPFDSDVVAISGFSQALTTLAKAYQIHRRNGNMSDYVPEVIRLIHVYYLDWQLQKGMALSEEYLAYVNKWFSRKVSYDTFMLEYRDLMKKLSENAGNGAYLTTLHGLKGLEFEDVYVIDLNDQLFPGTELNISQNLSDEQKMIVENEARRLFYVAITRTRNGLTLFFDAECPTRYLRFFKENIGIANTYEAYLNDSFTASNGFLVADNLDGKTNAFGSRKASPDILEFEDIPGKAEPISISKEPDVSDILLDGLGSFTALPGLDDLDNGIDDPTLGIDLDSPEAVAEQQAGKPGLIDMLNLKNGGLDFTLEQSMELQDIKDSALDSQLSDTEKGAIENKPVTRSILQMIMERTK